MMFRLLPLLVSLAAVAVASNVCSQFPYAELLPLSNYAPAEAFCSSRFPLTPCSTTITTSSTTIASSTVATVTVTTGTITTTATAGTVTSTVVTSISTASVTTGVTTITSTTGTSTTTTYGTTSTICTVAGDAPLQNKRSLSKRLRGREPHVAGDSLLERDHKITEDHSNDTKEHNIDTKEHNNDRRAYDQPSGESVVEAQFGSLSILTVSSTSLITATSDAEAATIDTVTATSTLSTNTVTTVSVQGTTITDEQATATVDGGPTTTTSEGCLASCTPGCDELPGGYYALDVTCDHSGTIEWNAYNTTTVSTLEACMSDCEAYYVNDVSCSGFYYDGNTGSCQFGSVDVFDLGGGPDLGLSLGVYNGCTPPSS
ncbi:hypothetical protein BDY17DRAFT_356256 [Neohortaea acidophila]|uniref:Apple domain-containing protein n=1 Tax=Neohortaea acidophila TaxID=245834 RepID=A0A6A6PIN2_9PEZI|nr:uncharacterized protein BDY17DRAFT_356256 [Neohortaea acidophila]KAF2479571.1 hypothetical protein BDY17DRAFT_356256 [Neohortaea acidophila]